MSLTARFFPTPSQLSIADGFQLLSVFANIENTKAFIAEVKDGVAAYDTLKAEVAAQTKINSAAQAALVTERDALEADKATLAAEKAAHVAAVAAFKVKADEQAELESRILKSIEALDARTAALDSRDSDLASLRAELDERAAALKQERQEFEARFSKAKALLAAVPTEG